MRIALPKLFEKKKEWEFQKADLTESTEELKNPARGWYQIFPFYADVKPDFRNIYWCMEDEDTIALVIINIGAFREQGLSAEALKNMRTILEFFQEQQYDVILRVTYDHEGCALEREPFFFEQVKEHMLQVAKVVREYENTIFIYQGLLVGNWGEMHTSKFVTHPKLKELWNILKEGIGEKIFTAVRKPSYWRALHPDNCGKDEPEVAKMGLFDDAIFGSETHLGTFGELAKESAGWEAVWDKASELEFENKICAKVPNGGEALCGEQYQIEGNAIESVDTLRKMHITYLNKTYDKLILKLWKEWKWEEAGVWQNKTVYEYIGNHLGYRFWIKDAMVCPIEGKKGLKQINIQLANVGFANYYHEAELNLEIIGKEYESLLIKVEGDLRLINSGYEKTLSIVTNQKSGYLYISAKRVPDGKRIWFANKSDADGRVFLGEIININ